MAKALPGLSKIAYSRKYVGWKNIWPFWADLNIGDFYFCDYLAHLIIIYVTMDNFTIILLDHNLAICVKIANLPK